jgi:nicotinate-nucleotide adenylyltransferase
MRRVGVLGGTFDPVHLGHLAVGRAAATAFDLDEVRLVPARVPPHRPGPQASGHHRFAMAALATQDEPRWTVSDIELRRAGPSFSIDTLAEMATAEALAATQIFFLIGTDAFAEIATWSRYPALLDHAHFVVVTRPGLGVEALRARVPDLTSRFRGVDDTRTSATTTLVLLQVATPDVSSTAVRAAAARGESLADLVPGPVERYIRKHDLYGSRSER